MNNNYIKVKIEGKNINNYIKWLINKKINIINLNIKKYNEMELIVYYKDFNLLSKYSKTYKVTIIKKYGKLRIFDILKNNIIILSSLILSIIFLYILSNIIFSIDIMYNDSKIVELITKELEKYDIKKYHLKKNYNYINKVKENILNDNKDTLEWIEIEESGTKYIVRVVERKKSINKEEFTYQSIIAKKNATITSIKAYSGEKNKHVNQFVNKGDVVISGIMNKPNNEIIYTKATGIVYGEVWYKVDIEYPLYYQEEKLTGKSKKTLAIEFLNYKIPLFPYKKYKQFKSKSNTILENRISPFKLINETIYEAIIKEEIYTYEEAKEKAIEIAKKNLLKKNKDIQNIKEIIVLDKQNLNSKIKLNLFVSVIEDITEIREIKEEINVE